MSQIFVSAAGTVSPCDGRAYRDVGATWSDFRDGAGTVGSATESQVTCPFYNYLAFIVRGILNFDLSVFSGNVDDITAINLYLYPYEVDDTFTQKQSICVMGATPAGTDNVVAADYTTITGSEYTDRTTLASMSANQYNVIPLNATGIAAVKAAIAGTISMGLRLSGDVDNVEMTGGTNAGLGLNMRDFGLSTSPYLEIITVTNFTRSLSDSVMIGASRTINLNRVYNSIRSLSDSIMNSAGRLATIVKGYFRNLSDSIMNGAGRFTILSSIYTKGQNIITRLTRYLALRKIKP